jgi:hypothetical protein
MRTNIPFLVISAERPEYSAPVNEWRTSSLRSQLESRDLQFAAVDGVYKGTAERSFVVFLPVENRDYVRSMLLGLGRRWGQESVLHVDANRGAELVYLDDRAPEELGVWQTVPADEAANEDGFTYSPDADAYYVARRVQ